MKRLALLVLCACASQSTGGQAVRADISNSKTVQQEGSWKAKFKFGPATPLSKSPSKTSAAVAPLRDIPPWMVFPADFDHGPVTEAEFSGKLPTTTTTTGETHVDESSWFRKAWKLGFSLWPWILGAAAIVAAALILFRKSGLVQKLARALPFPFSLLAIALPAAPKE